MERETFEIQLIDESRVKSAYGPGANCICIYKTKTGGLYKYVGTNPPAIEFQKGYVKVTAKVVNEENEFPRLQNIKLV